jgi:hypothetical protein
MEQQQSPPPREVVPLEYSPRGTRRPPFDWEASIRQFIFACGVGFIAGALIDIWYTYAWKDNEVLWIGFGAFLMALMIPWPGRVGWRRS